MLSVQVIVPTFRPEGYFLKCLESLFAQTYPKSRYSVVVVLNGPRHPFEDFVLANIPRLGLNCEYHYISTASVSAARNHGLSVTQSDCVLFVDDDDYLSPTAIEELVGCAKLGSLSACKMVSFDDATGAEVEDYLSRSYDENYRRGAVSLFRGRKFVSNACGKLIFRNNIGWVRFDVGLKRSEDAVFMYEISAQLNKVVFAGSSALYYRRLRQGSSSRARLPIRIVLKEFSSISFAYLSAWSRTRFRAGFFLLISRLAACFKLSLFRIHKC